MVRGLYTAAKGMMTEQAMIDVMSHNIANVNTPGYCKDDTLVSSFPNMVLSRIDGSGAAAIGRTGTGCALDGTYTAFEDGTLHETGNPLDLALSGNAFFTVRDRQGQLFFTRNGDFALNRDQQLVTGAGEAVLGENGGQAEEIFVPGGKLGVDGDGNLSGAVDRQGSPVSGLYLTARPDGADWSRAGDSLFSGASAKVAPGYTVRQGESEDSNVSAVEEMARMLNAMRAYEANAKVIQVTDNTLEKAVSSIGNL